MNQLLIFDKFTIKEYLPDEFVCKSEISGSNSNGSEIRILLCCQICEVQHTLIHELTPILLLRYLNVTSGNTRFVGLEILRSRKVTVSPFDGNDLNFVLSHGRILCQCLSSNFVCVCAPVCAGGGEQ